MSAVWEQSVQPLADPIDFVMVDANRLPKSDSVNRLSVMDSEIPGEYTYEHTSGPLAPRRRTRSDDAELQALEAQVERLLLTTEALWRIVKDKLGCDDKELVHQITLIDLEDGKLDARKPPSPTKPCPKCSRMLSKGRPRCLFCGEPIAIDPFER
jgi:hypothetical protein